VSKDTTKGVSIKRPDEQPDKRTDQQADQQAENRVEELVYKPVNLRRRRDQKTRDLSAGSFAHTR
jgi:hypothetical protein